MADLMKDCTPTQHFDFEVYKEVDFLLYLRSVLDLSMIVEKKKPFSRGGTIWHVHTRPYMEHVSNRFELFERAEQERYHEGLKLLLDVTSKEEYLDRLAKGGAKLGNWFKEYGMGEFARSLVDEWPT